MVPQPRAKIKFAAGDKPVNLASRPPRRATPPPGLTAKTENILSANLTPRGLLASCDWYREVFARDPALLAVLDPPLAVSERSGVQPVV